MTLQPQVLIGDCREQLKTLPTETVDLIMTSPPYANQRKTTYGGVHPDKYVEWFLPISEELYRVLKPSGSFVLNIKENVVEGERHTYVMELVIALRKQGWLWTEEYIWHKRNATPGKWTNRFRDAWEHLFHFTKHRHFKMYQDEMRQPMGDWIQGRKISELDKQRHSMQTGSGFGTTRAKWHEKDWVYPDNVLHLAVEGSNQGHSAVYPIELPTWFIKLFTEKGDTVLDPFCGSGTTLRAAIEYQRNAIGIELNPEYIKLVEERTDKVQMRMVV